SKGKSNQPNLHLATKEQLEAEIWPGSFPERLTIIGGGPASLSAAICATRAALRLVLTSPSGRVVDVSFETNISTIETHAIIVATGAESKWLDAKGEYEMPGGGVSSCATCDSHMYRGKHVLVVGDGGFISWYGKEA
ncbi:hypothetical protein ACHAXR_005734, partial [Thalassiosira sp. AJA248-18]